MSTPPVLPPALAWLLVITVAAGWLALFWAGDRAWDAWTAARFARHDRPGR